MVFFIIIIFFSPFLCYSALLFCVAFPFLHLIFCVCFHNGFVFSTGMRICNFPFSPPLLSPRRLCQLSFPELPSIVLFWGILEVCCGVFCFGRLWEGLFSTFAMFVARLFHILPCLMFNFILYTCLSHSSLLYSLLMFFLSVVCCALFSILSFSFLPDF